MPSVTPVGSSLWMEESSLFALMLPSFDYLIKPQQGRPESPVVSVAKPRRTNSAPSESTAPSTAQEAPALVPILRKRSSSLLSAARGDAARQFGRAMSHSASESSDLPSLTSSASSDSLTMEDDPESSSSSRHCHDDDDSEAKPSRAVSFCPRVWVRVFERSQRERDCIWYSPRDMEAFKVEALERIQHYYSCQRRGERSLTPTGSGRVVSTPCPAQRLLFSHEALQADCDVLSASPPSQMDVRTGSEEDEAANKIERILVVDSHEVCLSLLSQAFRLMFPCAVVHEAMNSTDALALVGPNERFDVIVIEERLNRVGKANDLLGSGSTLMAGIRGELTCKPLFIGVTSHPEMDTPRLHLHGADVVWSKPPPSINLDLRNELLRTISLKRGNARVDNHS